MKKIFSIIFFTAALFLLVNIPLKSAAPLPAMGRNGMVVSASEYASNIGVEILRKGGNAVDAAVAAAFALGVVEQYSSGIGGGNFILIYFAELDTVVAIDGREVAPKKAERDMFLDKLTGEPDPNLSTTGILAGGVPGAAASLCAAVDIFGSKAVSLSEILQPSIKLAEEGFIVNRTYFYHLQFAAPKLALFPASKAVYFKNDSTTWQVGDTLIQRDLGWSYRQIAESGPGAFYEDAIAEKFVTFEKRNKGLISAEDLKNYKERYRQPLRGTYRGLEIFSMSPPSSGGVHLIQMLNILEGFDLAQMGHNSSAYIHTLAEAVKPAFADRAEYLGDPDFIQIPLDTLISKGYSEIRRKSILPFQPADVQPGVFLPDTSKSHTTHISAMDRWGNLCAITATVNTTFGSGMTIDGTGIILNNEMDDFTASSGKPNFFGLVGKEANSIQPGKRPLSSMTPTIVLKEGKPFMALGSPGGPRIITSVLQTILNVVDFNMDIQEAVSVSRIHHQWKPDLLYVEGDIPLDVLANLAAKGHRIQLGGVGATVEAIFYDAETGFIYGGADPRNEGVAVGY